MERTDPTPEELQRLTEQFRAMGATDPASWARSQLYEGIPQFARLVFLQTAWRHVVTEDDTSWIDQTIQTAELRPRAPGAGAGPALKRLLAAGASPEDITEVVRVMQWDVLAGITYLLADPGIVEYPSEEIPRVNWAFVELDENDEPLHVIAGLYESVLDTEPSGREMRPKGVGREG